MTRRDILAMIDRLIQPPMTLEQALEELEQLATELEFRIDGIKDDMRQRDESLP